MKVRFDDGTFVMFKLFNGVNASALTKPVFKIELGMEDIEAMTSAELANNGCVGPWMIQLFRSKMTQVQKQQPAPTSSITPQGGNPFYGKAP